MLVRFLIGIIFKTNLQLYKNGGDFIFSQIYQPFFSIFFDFFKIHSGINFPFFQFRYSIFPGHRHFKEQNFFRSLEYFNVKINNFPLFFVDIVNQYFLRNYLENTFLFYMEKVYFHFSKLRYLFVKNYLLKSNNRISKLYNWIDSKKNKYSRKKLFFLNSELNRASKINFKKPETSLNRVLGKIRLRKNYNLFYNKFRIKILSYKNYLPFFCANFFLFQYIYNFCHYLYKYDSLNFLSLYKFSLPVILDFIFYIFENSKTKNSLKNHNNKKISTNFFDFSEKNLKGEFFLPIIFHGLSFLQCFKNLKDKLMRLFFLAKFETVFGKCSQQKFLEFIDKKDFKNHGFKNLQNFINFFSKFYRRKKIRELFNFFSKKRGTLFSCKILLKNGSCELFKCLNPFMLNLDLIASSKKFWCLFKIHSLQGFNGSNLVDFLFTLMILLDKNTYKEKVYWKQWLLYEMFKTSKNISTSLYKIRLSYLVLRKFNFSKKNFF